MKKIFTYLILLLTIPPVLKSQEKEVVFFDRITSENIKIEKGLSQNTVFCIMQDREGFMWFGTWDGLNKYDGVRFTIFNRESGLPNQTIYSLLQDSTGLVWIGTENGLSTYDPINGHIRNYYHDLQDSNSLTSNRITQIYIDHYGQIWIATARGLNKYRQETDDFAQYLNTERDNLAIRSNYGNQLLQDGFDHYWIATRYGLIRYDIESTDVTRYYHKPDDPKSLADNFVNCLLKDREGNLWVGTRNGLSVLQHSTKTFRNYMHREGADSGLSHNHISALLQDSQGNIWIGTQGGGLNLYDAESDSFITFRRSNINTSSISNNNIYSLLEDQAGNIWVGTFNGVNKIDRNSSNFKAYRIDPDNPNSLSNNFVRSFFEGPEGLIWIGTEQGINLFNEQTGEFSVIKKSENKNSFLPSNDIRDIFLDSRGFYWIGTRDSGIVKVNMQTHAYEIFRHDPTDSMNLCDNFVLKINEDIAGNIWIATERGLNVYNYTHGSLNAYPYDPTDPARAGVLKIYDIHSDESGTLWFASRNGLSRYYPDKDSFGIIRLENPEGNQNVSNELFDIYEDDAHNFWLSTRGSGLVHFNRKTGVFSWYDQKDGLPNNVIYGMLKDEEGDYWISTNWGISHFNPEKESFVNYDVRDGLQSNEFNSNAFMKTESGKMFFGGMMGFNCFYPDEIKINPFVPPVEITGFSIFNESKPPSWFERDTIHLNHDENFFTIHFAALDYTNPMKNKYRYILKNFDKKWRSTDAANPSAEYTKVNPGLYEFQVIGSNNDGIWNNTGEKRIIVITAPWWQRWVFRIPLIIVLVTTGSLLLWSRTRGLKRKHEVEKKMLDIEKQMFDLEQKALQLQMNPHFIFNSLNSIQSFVLNNDTDKAISYLAKFSQLMRLILSNSRESYIPLKDEITALSYYMDIEKLRFDDKFDYEIIMDQHIDAEFTEIPPMIIQPYLENAIIHGLINSEKKGKIKIGFSLDKKNISCVVEDNGIGRERAVQIRNESGIKRKSRGMLITKERLEILKKQHNEKFSVNIIDLKNPDGSAKGTRVELIIHYRESL
ncbi:MAG: histidine kinase [Bacteroidales bacterium]|nr:histidine kinase [Bacteroidales bacterium]MCF8344307.1 histidine kinase [Bacteroidales bacterium]MCF8375780.1 histidine kinase [Bacteroidales bacterium]MCF8401538.1 histidine kinase [Bacteroidales bacterium]